MLLRDPLNIEFVLVSVNNAHYELFVGLLYHPLVLYNALDDHFSALET